MATILRGIWRKTGALFDLLEKDVVPTFYDRTQTNSSGSGSRVSGRAWPDSPPRFSANRTVRQYTEEQYILSAAAYRHRAALGGQTGAELLARQRAVAEYWPDLHFGSLSTALQNDMYCCEVQVHLGRLHPSDVYIEMYADPIGDYPAVRRLMRCTSQGAHDGFSLYSAHVPATGPSPTTRRALFRLIRSVSSLWNYR